jgi:hypothetical protein
VNPAAPRIFTGPITEAFESALAAKEPVFLPQQLYADDRGWSLMNQLQGIMRS